MAGICIPETPTSDQNGKPLLQIDPAVVRAALDYDPETGVFTWKHRADVSVSTNTRWAGKIAGNIDALGYWRIGINGVRFKSHRLAFAYVTGCEPPIIVDHIDGNTLNNAFVNLRGATQAQNMQNARAKSRNVSGIKGVSWSLRAGKWLAQIHANGRYIYLGLFTTIEDAAAAYAAASALYHGEFGRLA